MTRRSRLDAYVLGQGWAGDLRAAQALILSGRVLVQGQPVRHVGHPLKDSDKIGLKPAPAFVSRAGEKLAGALAAFTVSPRDKVCWDIGASTGGFTDCLLRGGAKSVWAIDVGHGLLDQRLRNDPRVHLLEDTNVRHL